MDAAKRPDRERPYNGAHRRPALNLDTAYRSRWTVNAAGGRRLPVDLLLPMAALPVELPPVEKRAAVPPAGRLPIDLGPLVRLAQEACWGRFFNRPRHSAIADA
jgi:hypothetical protein